MELWIRSQDKHNLLKIDRLDVDDYTIQANFKAVSDDGFEYITIGRYKTNKRALEVLDEIQTFIEKQGTCEATSNEVGIINGIKVFGNVYEMPKE